MYGLYQSPGGVVKTKDSNSLDATLRELRKETALRIHPSRAKWLENNLKFDCDIYAIELDIMKNLQWTEQDKMGSWNIISWDMYINMVTSRFLISTHCSYTKIFLIEAGIISLEVNVIFDENVEEMKYDSEDAS